MKLYNVVTNDEYELPVALDLVGTKEVAQWLGMSVNNVRQRLCRGLWTGKYKAVEIGVMPKQTAEQRRANKNVSSKAYYARNRERILQYKKLMKVVADSGNLEGHRRI